MIDLTPPFISILLRVVEPTQRPRIVETVSVTGSATSIVTPAAVTALDRVDLSGSPAGTLDDALRAIPGFSLFRRSSSPVANPTTQGATLRGLAASGSSRSRRSGFRALAEAGSHETARGSLFGGWSDARFA